MRCEVHCSDTDIFINSLKRVADEVRIVQEEKSRWFIYSILHITPEDFYYVHFILFWSYSSLVSKEDFGPRQMQSSDNKIWPWSGPGPSCKWTDAVFKTGQYFIILVLLQINCNISDMNDCIIQGFSDPEYRKRRELISAQAFNYKQ